MSKIKSMNNLIISNEQMYHLESSCDKPKVESN